MTTGLTSGPIKLPSSAHKLSIAQQMRQSRATELWRYASFQSEIFKMFIQLKVFIWRWHTPTIFAL